MPVILLIGPGIATPGLADYAPPYFVNDERLVVGVAMDQSQPAAPAGGTRIGSRVGSFIGAWKMATRTA